MPGYAGLQTWKAFTTKYIRLEKTGNPTFPLDNLIYNCQTPDAFPTWLLVNDYPTNCEVDFVLQYLLSKQIKASGQKMVLKLQ